MERADRLGRQADEREENGGNEEKDVKNLRDGNRDRALCKQKELTVSLGLFK